MVFFLLKDRDPIIAWVRGQLPEERALAAGIWRDVDRKIGAYMRGKTYEIFIVGAFSWVAFTVLRVDYAILLASLSGLSVLVPYVGVVAVGVPVGLVSLVQFGPGAEFAAVLGAYTVIQIIDGNVLAPLLISEAVDIHPIAVVVAILVFGGIWGLWGVFFAIPLATVATSVFDAWPRPKADVEVSSGA
jgi:putative permease